MAWKRASTYSLREEGEGRKGKRLHRSLYVCWGGGEGDGTMALENKNVLVEN